ncbi:hypothetical protein FRB95_009846 [Tulasnella sp. JGI-2019a]|nr:hypothetical protein FRB95_009846 [Tulasnella sp. JGI-2019a]
MSIKQDKATNDRHSRILRELVKRPENKLCGDCKKHDPRWASWNIGVFVCIRCSGIHRSMGTHISKVKSVDLDVWTPEQIQSVQKWGNRRANLYWEAHLKSGHVPPDHKVDSFIRSKYDGRRWAMEGPPPDDPSTLEESADAEEGLPPQEVISGPISSSPPKSSSPTPGLNPGASRPARTLLSTTVANANAARGKQQSSRAPAAAVVAAPSPAPAPAPAVQPKPQDDLFSLDFHAAPSTSVGSGVAGGPKKADAKNDILSLFSSGPAAAAPAPANNTGAWGNVGGWGAPTAQPAVAAGPPSADIWGSFSSGQAAAPSNSLFGGMATTQPQAQANFANVWGAPAPAAAQPSFGGNVWGSSSNTSAASDPFASLASGGNTKPAPKKDDAFGDLWN